MVSRIQVSKLLVSKISVSKIVVSKISKILVSKFLDFSLVLLQLLICDKIIKFKLVKFLKIKPPNPKVSIGAQGLKPFSLVDIDQTVRRRNLFSNNYQTKQVRTSKEQHTLSGFPLGYQCQPSSPGGQIGRHWLAVSSKGSPITDIFLD